jgi:uncharacterized membrane protein YjgN (DUF898 family)
MFTKIHDNMVSTPAGLKSADLLRHGIESHPVQFTGSGAEYFRVWIVNLLLTVVTLGFYTPWARRRKAQYFYSNTQVAGSPLEFVAEQKRMVAGFLVFVALYMAYKLAVNTGQDTAAGLLLFSFAALAPFLWASAMRFRLGATRWRGIRLAFTATWKEVYLASWPVFAIAAVWTVAVIATSALSPGIGKYFTQLGQVQQQAEQYTPPDASGDDADTQDADENDEDDDEDAQQDDNSAPPTPTPTSTSKPDLKMPDWPLKTWQDYAAPLAPLGVALALSLLLLIRLEFNYKRLLVARARIGGQSGRWKPVYGKFVRVWLAAIGLFVLLLAGFLAAGWALLQLTGVVADMEKFTTKGPGTFWVFFMVMLLLIFMPLLIGLSSLPARAYREAGVFRLVWNNVGFSSIARTRCSLRPGAYVWLRVKNILLTVLTLGLYRPFARVSEYAAKVNSVTLYVKGGAEQLAGELVKQQGAFGDAAADALGLDNLIG